MMVRCPDCGSEVTLSEGQDGGQAVSCAQCGENFPIAREAGLPGGSKWYYAIGDEKKGPISQDEFTRLVSAGTIGSGTLVWRKGMAGWQALGEMQSNQAISAAMNDLPGHLSKAVAGNVTRLLAKIIDLVFMFALASMVEGVSRKLFPVEYAEPFSRVYLATMTVDMLLGVFYITWFVGKFGATPGKMLFNLKVETAAGNKVGYGLSFGRYCAEFVVGWGLCVVPAIMVFLYGQEVFPALAVWIGAMLLYYSPIVFDSQRRGLHDRLCATRVVGI